MLEEKEILNRIQDYEVMTVEAFEPYLEKPTHNKAALFLIKLKIIELGEDGYRLTSRGKEAQKQGLEFWLEDYVFNEIKENRFRKTKDTTEQERVVVRQLEADNKIYTSNNIRYSVTPKTPYSTQGPGTASNTENKKKKENWWERNIDRKALITGLLLLLAGAIITLIFG